jgi:hypothetical protein
MKRIALFLIFLSLTVKFATANPVYSINSDTSTSAVYVAPQFTTPNSGLAYTANNSVFKVRLEPLGNIEDYLVVMKGGLATLDLHGASSFSFLWGSPDLLNAFSLSTSLGTYAFSGVDLHSFYNMDPGKNASTTLFNINTSLGETLESISFTSGSNSFELAVPYSVPEPGTWMLVLSGIVFLIIQNRIRTKNTVVYEI